jgi:osmoprotectant transport system permease protein
MIPAGASCMLAVAADGNAPFDANAAPGSVGVDPNAPVGVGEALGRFFEAYGWPIAMRTGEHMFLVLVALLVACLIGVVVGIYLSRCRLKLVVSLVMALVNVIQPIPSLALVGFVAIIFGALGLSTIGVFPGIVVLIAYAVLPILRNTYTGMRQVDPGVKEVATAMGMTKSQILFDVELPLALPVIMAGVRIATVWTIGVGTLVAYIGAGGLGTFIFEGISNYNPLRILAGAVPAAILALMADWFLSMVENWLTPAGAELQTPG